MAERITSSFHRYSTAREVAQGHDLTGRTVVVTGAATGIGVETARALAEVGADVVIAARKPDLAREVVADIDRTAPGRTSFEMLDLSDPSDSCASFSKGSHAPKLSTNWVTETLRLTNSF